MRKNTIDLLVSCPISQIFVKDAYINKCQITLGMFSSEFQCRFRQGFSAQHCLLVMIEKRKKSVDKGKTFGALITDLLKTFECCSHDLIIAKLNTYGFSLSSSKLIQNYLP